MTIFFIMSGFVLCYNYQDDNFFSSSIFNFYKKRFVSIFPVYYFVYFFFLTLSTKSIVNIVSTFPIQFLLLQEFEHYPFLQNNGMWFLSVIMIYYFLFPLLCYVVSKKNSLIIFSIIFVVVTFMPFIANAYSLNMYTNIVFRILEFSIGIILCYNITKIKKNIHRYINFNYFI